MKKETLTMDDALKLYHKFEGMLTVKEVGKHFSLPDCDYCVRLSHKIWGMLLSIHSNQKGVLHLGGKKFPATALRELAQLNYILSAISKADLKRIDKELSDLDLITNNTH